MYIIYQNKYFPIFKLFVVNGNNQSTRNQLSSVSNENHATEKPENGDFSTVNRQFKPSEIDTRVHRSAYNVLELILIITKRPEPPSVKQLIDSVKVIFVKQVCHQLV